MRRHEPYDRGYSARGYGRDYGRDYGRGYGRDYGPARGVSFAGASFPMGAGYMPPWGWYGPLGIPAGPWPAYGDFGAYAPPPPQPPRRPPRESPAYGRGGDREVRRWAREHGYDVEYAVYPRENRRYR